jgi:hypothetical protein
VPPAPQLDSVDGGLASQRTRVDVVELHETAFVAPMPAYSDEGAPSEVA